MNTSPFTASGTMRAATNAEFNTAWGVTMPADLVALAQPAPYREPIRGLMTREVDEPELFKHFFG